MALDQELREQIEALLPTLLGEMDLSSSTVGEARATLARRLGIKPEILNACKDEVTDLIEDEIPLVVPASRSNDNGEETALAPSGARKKLKTARGEVQTDKRSENGDAKTARFAGIHMSAPCPRGAPTNIGKVA